jgi:copper chaperone
VQEILKMSIEGMHCAACVRRVTAALKRVRGVEVDSVEVGSAQMSFDTEWVSAKEIEDAVDRIGFVAHAERS